MPYTVKRTKEFNAAVARNLTDGFSDGLLDGHTWTLERDPHVGTSAGKNVWIIKACFAPIVATIYYTIDESREIVYLMDIRR